MSASPQKADTQQAEAAIVRLRLRTGDERHVGTCAGLYVRLPSRPEEDFYARVSFHTSDGACRLTTDRPVAFTGDDTDGGVFSALPSQGYTVLFWYDGRLQGLVRHTPIPCDSTEGR